MSLGKDRPWSVINVEPVPWRVTIWAAYMRAQVSKKLVRNWEGFHILGKMINECKNIPISSMHFQIGACYIHMCDFERSFRLFHFSEWCHEFTIFLLPMAWVTNFYIVLYGLPHSGPPVTEDNQAASFFDSWVGHRWGSWFSSMTS
jgi:hypothetical protein